MEKKALYVTPYRIMYVSNQSAAEISNFPHDFRK